MNDTAEEEGVLSNDDSALDTNVSRLLQQQYIFSRKPLLDHPRLRPPPHPSPALLMLGFSCREAAGKTDLSLHQSFLYWLSVRFQVSARYYTLFITSIFLRVFPQPSFPRVFPQPSFFSVFSFRLYVPPCFPSALMSLRVFPQP